MGEKCYFNDLKIGDRFNYADETWIKKKLKMAKIINGKYLNYFPPLTKIIKIKET